jgi:hypothetical protein
MRPLPLATLVIALAAPAEVRAQHTVAGAAWLSGCWEQRTGERLRVERWYEPANGVMRGTSRSFNGDTETAGERLRLELDGDTLVYAAHPSSQPAAEFRARVVSDTALIFENPEHDFPQRIVYRPQGGDSLLVTVEGDRDGRQQPLVFRFRRGDCAPGEAPADVAQQALGPLYQDLERRLSASANALVAWMVEHAQPGFTYRSWVTGGYLARTVPLAALERAARSGGGAAPPPAVVSVHVDAVQPNGDTAEVLVTMRQEWGQPGGGPALRQVVQRRLDRWVAAGGRWRLTSASLIGEDVVVRGQLTRRDGRPVTP